MIGDEELAAVVERKLQTLPADATHWSIRSMAMAVGHSHMTVRRIWNAFGLQPHRAETFKLSSDPLSGDKVRELCQAWHDVALRCTRRRHRLRHRQVLQAPPRSRVS
jgi:hypothetical protein